MSNYRLVVIAEEGVRLHDLDGDQWVIGREEGCELRLLDPSVSRKHALLQRAGDVFRLKDLGARNPVLVDGKPVTDGELLPGTEFVLGSTRLRIEEKEHSEIVLSPERVAGKRRTTVHVLGEAPTIGSGIKLTTLDEIADALARAETSEELAEHSLDLLFRALPLKRGFVGRIDQAGRIRRLAIRNRSEPDEDVDISKGILKRLLTEARPILISEEAPGTGGGRVRTLMAAPLKYESRVAGILYGDHPSRTRSFTPGDLHLVAVIGRLLASRLETLDLIERLRQENGEIRRWIGGEEPFVARSRAMQPVAQTVRKLGPHGIGVFIVGEPGSGKEAVGRELHRSGVDPRAPFVVVHCGALAPAHAETELFGRGKGRSRRHGKIVAAHGGILYLHEPERLPLELQARLAHLIEGGGLEAPGRAPIRISVRLVAGSVHHPEELGRKGLLSRQLLDLLCGSVIELPPLRARLDDIPFLVQGILKRLAAARAMQPAEMSARALQKLLLHHWPGNIRELARVVEGALLMSDGVTIAPRDLPAELRQGDPDKTPSHAFRTLDELEKDHIFTVLEAVGGSRLQAASILGIAPSTLYEKLRRLQGEA